MKKCARTLQRPVRHSPPTLGAHQSIAGGLSRAVDRAVETGCQCLQIFTRNINRWDVSPIDPDHAAIFRNAVKTAGLSLVVAHDSYLINPASADPSLRTKSIHGLITELTRAEQLGIPWVVAHPGAAGDQLPATAIGRAGAGIAEALDRTRPLKAGILIPGLRKRVGVCLDTCHVFAAGYALAPREDLDATLHLFDTLIGIKRLVVIHANDSKKGRGSRVDRHEAIGKGAIGREAFRLIMNHPMLAGIPLILETPKEGLDGKASPANDRANLATLRRMVPRPLSSRGTVRRTAGPRR